MPQSSFTKSGFSSWHDDIRDYQSLLGALEAIRDMECRTGKTEDTLALCRAVAKSAIEQFERRTLSNS